jgi:hypothetical protein
MSEGQHSGLTTAPAVKGATAMREQDWLACSDPKGMVEFVGEKASDRKKRLFTVACCRRIWSLMADNRSQMAVEVAERFADGLANRRERKAAIETALAAREDADAAARQASADGDEKQWGGFNAAFAAMIAVSSRGYDPWDAANAAGYAVEFLTGTPKDVEHVAQVAFVLDIFDNPFRPALLNAAWQTPTVLALAPAAYENRILPAGTLEPARLAVLADALEEAGCDDADILSHCRQRGVHVRGCWLLDLLLGKE